MIAYTSDSGIPATGELFAAWATNRALERENLQENIELNIAAVCREFEGEDEDSDSSDESEQEDK